MDSKRGRGGLKLEWGREVESKRLRREKEWSSKRIMGREKGLKTCWRKKGIKGRETTSCESLEVER